MTKSNDSVAITPGAGEAIALHTVDSKGHQVFMQANAQGHILGSLPTYSAWSGVVTAAANKVYMHVFNASGSGVVVKMRKLFIQPNMAVTAIGAQDWRLSKTSAVGTTASIAITIQKHATSNGAVPSQVTAAHSFTAGGTTNFDYFGLFTSVEETLPGVHMAPYFNILPVDGDFVQDYELAEGEGIKLTNVTGGAYSYSALAIFTIE